MAKSRFLNFSPADGLYFLFPNGSLMPVALPSRPIRFSLFLEMALFGSFLRLTFLIAFVVACRTASPPLTEELDMARRYLGGDLDSFPNRSGTHLLYVQQAVPGQTTKFVVIERASRMVVEEGSFIPGYVEWKSEDTLEVLSVPGTLKKGEDLSKYIKTIRLLPKN